MDKRSSLKFREKRVSGRALFLTLLLLLPNVYLIGMLEGVWHTLHMTTQSVPMNSLVLLLFLVGINQGIKRFAPQKAFSSQELLVIYFLLSLASVVLSHDTLLSLMGVIPHYAQFANPENRWENLFGPYLPKGLLLDKPEIARRFYSGNPTYWDADYLLAWAKPALLWGIFVSALMGVLLSLNVFLRQPWAEYERLSFPLLRLPMELVDPQNRLLRQSLFWTGLLLASSIQLLNGLHYLYPFVPALPVKGYDLLMFLKSPPWNAIGGTSLAFYPFVIGLAFLLPTDLCFSLWFFFLMGKALRVLGSAMAWDVSPRYPYLGQQAVGAIVFLSLYTFWRVRKHLYLCIYRAIKPEVPLDLLYRYAFCVLFTSGLFLVGFCLYMRMSLLILPFFLGLYLFLGIGVARLRAEVGPPVHSILSANPQDVIELVAGTQKISRQDLTALHLFHWFNRYNRAHPMSQSLEALQAGVLAGIPLKPFWMTMLGTVLIALVLGFLIFPLLFHRHGAGRAGEVVAVGWSTFNGLQSVVASPQPSDLGGSVALIVGGVVAVFLSSLRVRYAGWPLHPAGYALGMSSAVDYYWVALVITWTVKVLIVRYGGVKGYRTTLPFFLGIIMGDYLMAFLWSLASLLLGQATYEFWP